MKLLENLTTASLLVRCLATLRDLARSQRRLAAAAEQRNAIDCLRAGIKPSQLPAALKDAEKDSPTELLTQSEAELAELDRLQREADARGVRVPEEEDLYWFLNQFERDMPGGPDYRKDGE